MIAAERQSQGLGWGRALSERELDLLYEAPHMPLKTLAEVLGSDVTRGTEQTADGCTHDTLECTHTPPRSLLTPTHIPTRNPPPNK